MGTDANGAFYVSVLQDRQFSAQTAMCIYKYPRYSRGLQTQILTDLSDVWYHFDEADIYLPTPPSLLDSRINVNLPKIVSSL